MMRSRGFEMLLFTVTWLPLGCGGSVDLQSPSDSNEAGRGGSGGRATEGAAGRLAAGGSVSGGTDAGGGGEQQGMGGSGVAGASGGSKSDAGMAGESAQGGSSAMPGDERMAWLAFDAQPEGESRGIYWMSAPLNDCLRRLTDDGVNAKQPAFSSDGKFIAYASDESGTYQIYTQEIDTGRVERLTDLPQGATYPTFAPDGIRIAFVTGDPEGFRDGLVEDAPEMGDVMIVNAKTLETELVEARDPNPNLDYPYFAPAFSGNDRLLVSNSHRILALYFDLAQSTATPVMKRELTSPGVPQEPAPSPDGQRLAYADTCTDTLRLYAHRIDTGSPRSCVPPSREYRTDAGIRAADWGEFGFIVVQHNEPASSLQLFSETDLSLGGSLATPSRARNPSWAPGDFVRACR